MNGFRRSLKKAQSSSFFMSVLGEEGNLNDVSEAGAKVKDLTHI